MKLLCYPASGPPPDIRPAPATRAWMDASPVGYAYRCLPLNIANAHGWEILNPSAYDATWDDGVDKSAIQISGAGAISHFGCGVFTFHVMALFRTEPGWDLFVTGPVNAPKHGIAPLTGVVETDWAHSTFTMNWKFTAPGTRPVGGGGAVLLLLPHRARKDRSDRAGDPPAGFRPGPGRDLYGLGAI